MNVQGWLKKALRKLKFTYKIFLSYLSHLYMLIVTNFRFMQSESAVKQQTPVQLQIVLDPIHKGWVIEKLAKKIIDYWPRSSIPTLTYFPKPNAVVTHWMHFMNVPIDFLENSKSIHTVQVTHIDSIDKLRYLQKLIGAGAIPVFMSEQHAEQVSSKIARPYKSHSIIPGSDTSNYSERKRILILSNYYPDGRKNENLLINLAKEHRLDTFHFTFIGKSWEKIAKVLVAAGAEVETFSPNDLEYPSYDMQVRILRGVDCYLYLGFDEGSLGALDAYLLGTPMIISKQGFHLEFPLRSDIFLFENYEDFKNTFLTIPSRNQLNPDEAQKWSWYSYAERYQRLWDALILEFGNK